MSAAVAETEPRSFSDVSALTPINSGLFEAEIDPEWTIGGKPNGGYLLCLAGGRLDEVCYVWDSAGQLVAHGTQLAGVRLI